MAGVELNGIHHVSVNVSDVDRALHFYVDGLGLTPLPRPDFPFGGAWLGLADGRQVHLIEAPVPDDRGQHVAFAVSDLDAVVIELRARGLEVSTPREVGETGSMQSFLSDPDGNRIELQQPA